MSSLARWLVLSCLSVVTVAQAHEVMGSVVFVDLGRAQARLDVELPIDELRLALQLPSQVGASQPPLDDAGLTTYALAHVRVRTTDWRPFAVHATARPPVEHDQRQWARVRLDATPPVDASARDLVIDTDLITHQVVSHRIFVFLRHDLETGLVGEAPTFVEALHYQRHETHVSRAPGSLSTGLGALVRLGMRHIAQGSDHLLFLFTLLIPAGLSLAGRRWSSRRGLRESLLQLAKTVTAFTLGHSVTLALGALGLARLPTQWVESLIAVSLLVSAAHVVVPLFPRREAWVALGFGLVHGLGFASALEGLGVDGATLVLSVLAFNVGVEVMQATLVAVSYPVLFALQGTRGHAALRVVAGVLSAGLACAWLAQRSLGVELKLDAAPWVLAGLGLTAMGVVLRRGTRSVGVG